MCRIIGMEKMTYLISYDIEEDRTRTKLSKLLQGYGVRIQYSVFECSLTDARFQKLYGEILKLTTEKCAGSVRFYPLCKNCMEKIMTIGKPLHEPENLNSSIIVI